MKNISFMDKINTWLYDILNSIDEIESFFEGKTMNLILALFTSLNQLFS